MPDQGVILEIESQIATVTLNRAETRNVLDRAMLDALIEAGEILLRRRDLRAVVLCSEGKDFCAGLDPRTLQRDPAELEALRATPSGEHQTINRAQRACWIWQEMPVPVIAALQGSVLGSGLQLALAADLRVCAPDTLLCVAEARYGLIPDQTATQTLLHLVREDIARELTFTARMVDATEAQTIGLVTRIATDPLLSAQKLARDIATRSPDAIRAAKRLYQAARYQRPAVTFRLETELQLTLLGKPNQREAVAAALAKRPPVFENSD